MKHPADAIVHAGHVGRGLAKGVGVLLGRTTGYYLVEQVEFWRVKPTLGAIFSHVVARATHANVRLRR